MNNITIFQGHILNVLPQLPANSVHCVVTSPPYWGLRRYIEDNAPEKKYEIGGEETPGEYVGTIVKVFQEVRRVLRPDGVCFLNIGDSYAASGGSGSGEYQKRHTQFGKVINPGTAQAPRKAPPGLKPKDLVGIPWRVAFALQDAGWYLRSDIIWFKNNPVPEPVKDRPTKSHEYVFLLTKSKNYYWDKEAVREKPVTGPMGRNLRSVWQIPTQSYSGVHFAVFPETLAEKCIMAGTSECGVCPICGAPYKRLTIKGDPVESWKAACGADKEGKYKGKAKKDYAQAGAEDPSDVKARILNGMREIITIGWEPTCSCSNRGGPVPAIVLDPFFGAGTSGLVAARLGRDTLGGVPGMHNSSEV